MIFYYALGGGLGHVTRAQALIHTLGLDDPVTLAMTSAWDESLLPIPDQFQQVRAPQALSQDPTGLRAWLESLWSSERYRTIIIDAFPAGVLGELSGLSPLADTQMIHCARRLKWTRYAPLITGKLPRYDACYLLESLSGAHLSALRATCSALRTLKLRDRPLERAVDSSGAHLAQHSGDTPRGIPLWLIVHAGSADELRELTDFAIESAALEGVRPRLLLISPQRPDGIPAHVEHGRIYPAHPLFSRADRIFTACGFNTVRQLSDHRAKHRYQPFSRRFDDQHERAAALRSGEWDRFS